MVVEKTRGTYRSTEMGTLRNCKNRTSLELQFVQKEEQHWLLYMHAAYTTVSEVEMSRISQRTLKLQGKQIGILPRNPRDIIDYMHTFPEAKLLTSFGANTLFITFPPLLAQ